MNLHGIVAPIIGAINPNVVVTVKVSTGYTVDTNHVQVPGYAVPVAATAQIQPLSFKEIQQVDGLNLQGTQQAFYLYGHVAGIVRVKKEGGDVIVMADGTVWLIVLVSEQWPDWCRVVGNLQDGS